MSAKTRPVAAFTRNGVAVPSTEDCPYATGTLLSSLNLVGVTIVPAATTSMSSSKRPVAGSMFMGIAVPAVEDSPCLATTLLSSLAVTGIRLGSYYIAIIREWHPERVVGNGACGDGIGSDCLDDVRIRF